MQLRQGADGGFVRRPIPTLLFTFCCTAAPALSDMTNRSARFAETGGESERTEVAARVHVQRAQTEGFWVCVCVCVYLVHFE